MLEDVAQRIAACTAAADAGVTLQAEIARHGYTSSGCGILTFPAGGHIGPERGLPYPFLFRNWRDEWAAMREQIGAARFAAAEASLIVAEARKRLTPFSWHDIAAERGLTRLEAEVCNELTSSGWRDGLYAPIHGPGGYFAVVGMASPERDLDRSAASRAHLMMIAALAHERALALMALKPFHWPLEPLTLRERECMRWIADGKTDREIAKILRISPTTVKFFVNGARAKFGARTRAQAVARFVLSGLF